MQMLYDSEQFVVVHMVANAPHLEGEPALLKPRRQQAGPRRPRRLNVGRNTSHTSTHPGKWVRIVLKDGTAIEDRFKERTGQFVVLDNHRLKGRDIDKFLVLKSPPINR